MNKEQALDLLCNAVACYVEDCISTAPKSETDDIWQAFGIVEDDVLKSIRTEEQTQ
jgi:hypothetical protein